MIVRSVFALTISFSLFSAAGTFGQTQSGLPHAPLAPVRLPVGQHVQNRDTSVVEAQNQANSGNPQWSAPIFSSWHTQPFIGTWLDNDQRTAGLTLSPADDALRTHLKLPSNQGLVVASLDPHSAAGQSGIQLNDVLLSLGDAPLRKPEDLDKNLKSVGEKPVVLQLLRAGKETKIQIQPQIHVTFRLVPPKPPEKSYWIGISVSQLDPTLRAQLQIPEHQGLIVSEVVKDSPASRAEIKVNDILFKLDGKPMDDSSKLADLVQSHAEKPMSLDFIREGKTHWSVEVTPERRKVAEAQRSAAQLYNARLMILSRPGAVVNYSAGLTKTAGSNVGFVYDRPNDTISVLPNHPTKPNQPADASADISKRLDSLDASIKQLRLAIEELSRATKEKK